MKILLQKTTLIIIFNKQKQSEVFREKKKCCFINTIFRQPCMAGEFLPITKEVASRKKKMCVKLIYSIKTNTIISFFSKFLVKFLRNSIKYVVLRAVSSALKVSLLKAMVIQSAFSDDSFKWRWKSICNLEANGLGKIFARYCVW